jgi:voltage-gated potassium channel
MTRKKVFDIIQISNHSDFLSSAFDVVLVAAILLNIAAMFLETFSGLSAYLPLFHGIEFVTVIFFCAEYILRIWTADYLYADETKGKARLKFIFSFDGVVELLTIIPLFFLSGFVVFRMLRVVRIFHLFRINANMDSFNVIVQVLYEKKNQILSSLFIVIVLMLAASLSMYSAEHAVQPEAFRNAFDGLWWSVSALLTVGYGDIYPITVTGKIMAIIISFLGVGAVAIPTGIISAGFVEQYTKAQASTTPSETIDMIMDIDSAWLGMSAEEVRQKSGRVILLVERNGETYVPDKTYNVQVKDHLTVFNETEGHKRKQ